MKRWIKIVFVIMLLFVIVGFSVYYVIQRNLEQLENMKIGPMDLSDVEDGVYLGKYSVLPISVTVQVSVTDHKIVSIEIIEHLNGQGGKAEKIIYDIVAEQSINVDVVSGATYSSQVIKSAILQAFK